MRKLISIGIALSLVIGLNGCAKPKEKSNGIVLFADLQVEQVEQIEISSKDYKQFSETNQDRDDISVIVSLLKQITDAKITDLDVIEQAYVTMVISYIDNEEVTIMVSNNYISLDNVVYSANYDILQRVYEYGQKLLIEGFDFEQESSTTTSTKVTTTTKKTQTSSDVMQPSSLLDNYLYYLQRMAFNTLILHYGDASIDAKELTPTLTNILELLDTPVTQGDNSTTYYSFVMDVSGVTLSIDVSDAYVTVRKSRASELYALNEALRDEFNELVQSVVETSASTTYQDSLTYIKTALPIPGFLPDNALEVVQKGFVLWYYMLLNPLPFEYLEGITEPVIDEFGSSYYLVDDAYFVDYNMLYNELLQVFSVEIAEQLLENSPYFEVDSAMYVSSGMPSRTIELVKIEYIENKGDEDINFTATITYSIDGVEVHKILEVALIMIQEQYYISNFNVVSVA